MSQRLIKNSKLTNRQLNELVKYFALEVPESVIYTDSFRSYDGLVLDGFKHYRINHRECFATSKRQHINGIENFWGYAKTKLKSYYGVSRGHFYLYLKEMEFRFNHRKAANLAALIKKTVRKHQAVLD